MGRIEERIAELGLELPAEVQMPPGVTIPFEWVRVHGTRVFVSGHGPLAADGTPLGPFGKVPSEVALEDAQASARAATLNLLANLGRTIGDLDRVAAWLMVSVNVTPIRVTRRRPWSATPFRICSSRCSGPRSARTPGPRWAWPLFRSTPP